MIIIADFSEKASRDIVQNLQFSFLHCADFRHFARFPIDFPKQLWYADYVGAVIGTACFFAEKATVSYRFVNFHMETFQNSARIGYLLSWFFSPVIV